jgi:hypothetical protein
MSVFKKIKGIIGDLFVLGIDTTNHGIKDHADGVEMVNYDGTVRNNAIVARPQGANQDVHAATYLDLKERVVDIEWAFNGGGPVPAPGTNTGKYGLCHTSGGGYAAGDIYLDDGVALILIPMYHMMTCSPRNAITGTVSMIADGLYLAEASAAPWNWTLKGDGAATATGIVQAIEVGFGFADFPGTKSSTTSIPSGAKIIRSIVKVTTAFTPGAVPTLLVEVDGPAVDTSVQLTTDNNIKRINQYDVVDEITVPAAQGGPVRLTFAAGGAVLAGVGTCLVEYVTPFA